jgi:hypothetical protein
MIIFIIGGLICISYFLNNEIKKIEYFLKYKERYYNERFGK